MTTEERIADIERRVDEMLVDYPNPQESTIACELRALRLMLRDELRGAAWETRGTVVDVAAALRDGALASRKAHEPGRWDGFSDKELRVMQMCFSSKDKTRLHPEVTRALASRKAPLEDTP